MRQSLRILCRFLFRLLTHVQAEGVEHILSRGGCILATNHLGRLDVPLVFIFIERNDLTGLVAKKYQRYPLIRWLVNLMDGIWLDREQADIAAMRAARDYVNAGGMLGIAPEGTRSTGRALLPGKPGIAFLASKVHAPIIPIAVTGTETAITEWMRLRRPHLKVRFGTPFHLPPLDRKDRDESLQRNTDEIMCRIAALLPPGYRGSYADAPRLQELLTDADGSHT